MGSYSFITPYAHEVTHGVLFSTGALYCLWKYASARNGIFLVATGISLGLVFLSKPEVFAACLAGVGTGLVPILTTERSLLRIASALFAITVGAFVPPVAALIGLSTAMSLHAAWSGLTTAWLPLANPALRHGLASLRFYQVLTFSSDPHHALAIMLGTAAFYLLLVGIAFKLSLSSARFDFLPAIVGLLGGIAAGMHFEYVARPVPALLGLWIGLLAGRIWRHGKKCNAALTLKAAWSAFGFVLLLRIGFNVSLFHYGFALAMPGTIMLLAVLMDEIPLKVSRAGGSAMSFRGFALALVAVIAIVKLAVADQIIQQRQYPVGRGPDQILADERGLEVREALDVIGATVAPDQTLAVLPEGAMVNYMARRKSSVPFITLMPPELLIFGETTILRSLAASPPDYVALVHKDTSEYGVPLFGHDYGELIMNWIRAHYTEIRVFGAEPLKQEQNAFGIALLRKNAAVVDR